MKNKTIKAFTLVELIVVITILSILWTISFISLQGYSKNARNWVRTTDLSLMKKSIELSSIKKWSYPKPDDEINVSYSWANLFYQWNFWNSVLRQLSNISKIPIDPLLNIEYSYSVSWNFKQYQLSWFLEESLYWTNKINTFNKVNAINNSNIFSYTLWNYNLYDLVAKNGNNCVNITLPSININNLPVDWVLLTDWNYNFVYNNSINLPTNFNSLIDNVNPWISFSIKEVLNKCSIDSLDELNTYINLLSTTYQQYIWEEVFDELIYDSYKIYSKIDSVYNLRKNWIQVSDDIIDEIYAVSPNNIFSDTFAWINWDELVWWHTADTFWTWEFIDPLSNTSSYIISWNELLKSDTSTSVISPVPSLPITSNNYIISFDINDFAWWQINVFARYTDEDNYYWLKLNETSYEMMKKVWWVESAFSSITENIPVNSKIEFNIYWNNLVLLINDIEKENIIDDSVTEIWKVAIQMLNQDSLIDNFVLKYK